MSMRLDGSVTLESSTRDGSARIQCWMAHAGYVPIAEARVYTDDKARTVLLKSRDGIRYALVQAINDKWLREALHDDGALGGWTIFHDLNAPRETP